MGQAATNIDFARGLYLGPKVAVVHQNIDLFLVACYATLHPALSVRPSVGPSVRPSVTLYFFGVNGVFGLTAPAQMLR